MFLINHFLDKVVLGVPVPFRDQANVTNAATGAGSLGAQVDTCVQDHGRNPNFLLVDVRLFLCLCRTINNGFFSRSSMSTEVALSSRWQPLPTVSPTAPQHPLRPPSQRLVVPAAL